MKGLFLHIQTSRDLWFDEALERYLTKLNHFFSFEVKRIQSDSSSRMDRSQKVKSEDKLILSSIKATDLVLAFDEKGRTFVDSRAFSAYLVKKIEMGKPRIVFVVGGAFGLGAGLRERTNDLISLGPLTLNHHLAMIVAMEQIYRGLTIWKGIPYHND
ncbi:MAG: 23S rRNA (pseudouridine(1915)-N(3))-methyltransferase RlmH [Bdellovibrionales bacterium]|nr:23S rRNA (pseudouridine(1915)-N(3))-methyltransferase RlmH [Bdellovibrionales bacterium]